MPELLPPGIQREVLESKDKAIQYDQMLSKLTASTEWAFLMHCVKYYREQIIQSMKVAGSPEAYLQKLIAVDLLIDLPKDIRTALGAVDEAAAPPSSERFGFTEDDTFSPPTTLQTEEK